SPSRVSPVELSPSIVSEPSDTTPAEDVDVSPVPGTSSVPSDDVVPVVSVVPCVSSIGVTSSKHPPSHKSPSPCHLRIHRIDNPRATILVVPKLVLTFARSPPLSRPTWVADARPPTPDRAGPLRARCTRVVRNGRTRPGFPRRSTFGPPPETPVTDNPLLQIQFAAPFDAIRAEHV